MKKIIVYGATHLGITLATCLAKKNFIVTITDGDLNNLNLLLNDKLPIYEPIINELFFKLIKSKKIILKKFKELKSQNNIIFFAKDSEKTKNGINLNLFKKELLSIKNISSKAADVIVMSQIPVGTLKNLRTKHKLNFKLNYIPEFLRLGNAYELFIKQNYIIIGTENVNSFNKISKIMKNFSKYIYNCSVSEAEFSKHFVNIYISSSVSLISEFTKISKKMNINLSNLAPAIRRDDRIGPKSYIYPGLGFSGGNLERDLTIMNHLLLKFKKKSEMINAIIKTNNNHNKEPLEHLIKKIKNLKNKKISILGVTYKEFTDTLRGSIALNYKKKLEKLGAIIKMYDPIFKNSKNNNKTFSKSIRECIHKSDILITMINKKEFGSINYNFLKKNMKGKIIYDLANIFFKSKIITKKFDYYGIGTGF